MCQDVERRYLNTALETAYKMLANLYVTSATAGTRDVLTSLVSPFYQRELCPAYHYSLMQFDTAFGFQHQVGSLQPERETRPTAEDSQTSYGHFASLSSEAFPLLAEGRKKRLQTFDEDPVETYLILDNTEPGKQRGF